MKRTFLWIGSGIMAGALTASIADKFWTVIAIVFFLVAAICCFFRRSYNKTGFLTFFLFAVLGASLFLTKTNLIVQPVTVLQDHSAQISGVVSDFEVRENGRYTYYLSVDSVVPQEPISEPYAQDFSLILYSNYDLSAQWGDRLKVTASLYLPSQSGMFDSKRYYSGKNIYLLAHTAEQEAIVIPAEKIPLSVRIREINLSLDQWLKEHFSPESYPIMSSMLLGNRSQISDILNQQYTDAGGVHVLAISGLHLSILAGFCLIVLRKTPKQLRIFLFLGILCFFTLLSGQHLSTVRSAIMLAMLQIGTLFHRQSDGINSLGIAVFFIVFLDVYAIMDIGFLMSVSATLGILLFFPTIHQWTNNFTQIPWLIRRIGDIVGISLSANLLLIPIFVLEFGTISLVAPITNLILSFTAPIVLVSGFLLLIFCWLPLPHFLFSIPDFTVQLQNQAVEALSRLPYASIGLDFWQVKVWFFASIFLLGIGYFLLQHRGLKLAGICSAVLFTIFYSAAISVSEPQLYLIGDGTSTNLVFLYQGHATVLSTSDSSYIDTATLRYLKRKNIHTLDNLITTYPHTNTVRDTQNLLAAYPANNIFLSEENAAMTFSLERSGNYENLFSINQELSSFEVNGIRFIPMIFGSRIYFEIQYGDLLIYLGSYSSAKYCPGAAIYCITGQPEIIEQDMPSCFLLEKPYHMPSLEQPVGYAYQQCSGWKLHREGYLSPIKD